MKLVDSLLMSWWLTIFMVGLMFVFQGYAGERLLLVGGVSAYIPTVVVVGVCGFFFTRWFGVRGLAVVGLGVSFTELSWNGLYGLIVDYRYVLAAVNMDWIVYMVVLIAIVPLCYWIIKPIYQGMNRIVSVVVGVYLIMYFGLWGAPVGENLWAAVTSACYVLVWMVFFGGGLKRRVRI